MGQPTRESIIEQLKAAPSIAREELLGLGLPPEDVAKMKAAELVEFAKDREKLLAQEGKRPVVNDPRKDAQIKTELTPEEVKAQEKATEAWANRFLSEDKKS